MFHAEVVDRLLESEEPSIRWKIRTGVLREPPGSPGILSLQEEVRTSPRVAALLSGRTASGRIVSPHSVYDKWQGAHWVLASLADLGYPAGDPSLASACDQVLTHWIMPYYYEEFEAASKAASTYSWAIAATA